MTTPLLDGVSLPSTSALAGTRRQRSILLAQIDLQENHFRMAATKTQGRGPPAGRIELYSWNYFAACAPGCALGMAR